MTRTTTKAVLSLSALALLITGAVLYAGPLDPPPGPVTSTYKTLGEVEPRIAINAANTPGDADSLFKITQPGSYYLTGNITGVAGKHGIEIVASGVSLDLNGFDLVGVPAGGNFDGVSVTVGSLTNIAVVNGSVRNWGRDGIGLGETAPYLNGGRIESVRASGNARVGVHGSINFEIVKCSGANNQFGVIARQGSTFTGCSASGNSLYGIYAESGSAVTNCSANQNSGVGIWTFDVCTITGCSALDNSQQGIVGGAGSTIQNCSASGNTTNGIVVSGNGTITGCTVTRTTGVGIAAGAESTVVGCSVRGSTSIGINVGSNSTVAECTAANNVGAGITCAARSLIRNNQCSSNSVGLHIPLGGIGNRIEGNNFSANSVHALHVVNSPNIIFSNSSTMELNPWNVAAGNVGLFIIGDHSGGATFGRSGGIFPGSTDPNTNYTY